IGNRLHRLEIPLAGNGETGFDDIHPHPFQRLGDTQFFVLVHGGAGALLAVTQGGIEYDQAFFVHHRISPSMGFVDSSKSARTGGIKPSAVPATVPREAAPRPAARRCPRPPAPARSRPGRRDSCIPVPGHWWWI